MINDLLMTTLETIKANKMNSYVHNTSFFFYSFFFFCVWFITLA